MNADDPRSYESIIARYGVENREAWHESMDQIPFIKFPSCYAIKVIPPFGGAMARFIVKYKDKTASVYLDFYMRLGSVSEPYWEVYPVDDDVGRCAMDDITELLRLIAKSVGKRGQ